MTEKTFQEIRGYKPPENWKDLKGKEREEIEEKVQKAAEYDALRTFAKSLGFGLNYGIMASTLAETHSMPEEDVQDMIDMYFQKYEGLALWRETQKDLSLEKGLLVLPETGRKRRFYGAARWFGHSLSQDCRKRELDIEGIHRQAMNFPIQGFANEVFTQGKLRFARALKKAKLRCRMLLSLHDGILLECPKSELKEVREIALKSMQRDLGSGKKLVRLEADFDVYDRWGGEKLKVA
jgi:DNA polymerase-1